MNNTSSNVAINLGARLIILRYLLWDLMCFVLVFFSLYILLLLSAVDMIMVCRLACGIGIAGRTRVVLTLTSVLDLLYSKYTLRDLVCWLGLYLAPLVGGAFDSTLSYVGLWYWWFAETSSYYGITTGARPLI